MSDKSIYERLCEYSDGNAYPFHMPGHKRNIELMNRLYDIDITEINGFDDLHHADGILLQGMQRMAQAVGALKSYYIVNGSTCGILAAVYGACRPGSTVAVARNTHRSVANAVILRRLKPVYIYPQMVDNMWINSGITGGNIDDMYKKNGDISAVIITTPTYEGLISDVSAIAEAVHRHGGILIADEAHGSHLNYGDNLFGKSAVEQGADIVIQSMHKNLPAMTQSSVLHICSSRVNIEDIESAIDIFETSSPSYIMMAGMDACVRYMQTEGKKRLKWLSERLDEFYIKAKEWEQLIFLDSSCIKVNGISRDKSKIVIAAKYMQCMGKWLHKKLEDEYGLVPEMSVPEYVVLIAAAGDTEEGFFRLEKALGNINSELRAMDNISDKRMPDFVPLPEAELKIYPFEAAEREKKSVDIKNCKGCICAESIFIYPPGIPFIMPGEIITQKHIDLVEYYKECGIEITGLRDRDQKKIMIIEDEKVN